MAVEQYTLTHNTQNTENGTHLTIKKLNIHMPICPHDSTWSATPKDKKLVLRCRQHRAFSFVAVHTTVIKKKYCITLYHGKKMIRGFNVNVVYGHDYISDFHIVTGI
jgi:hypothetical protein